jgi:hypothetical protein
MKYNKDNWRETPDDPNRVGDEDFQPNTTRNLFFKNADEEYRFYMEHREPMKVKTLERSNK